MSDQEPARKRRRWRALDITAVILGAAAIVAIVVSLAVWNDDPPTEAECKEQFREAIDGGEFDEECQQRLDSTIEELELRAEVISACKDAVSEEHAVYWSIPLEFKTVESETVSDAEFRVTGEAEFTDGQGDTNQRSYSCSVAVDDGPRVLTVGVERR